MEDLIERGNVDGTRSILDICYVSDTPFPHENWEFLVETAHLEGIMYHFTTYPLSSNNLFSLFGTVQPTHELIESVLLRGNKRSDTAQKFWRDIERGTSKHIIVYFENKPIEIFFAGYSFD
jgi:hypothetical protein